MSQWPHDDTASKMAFYGDFHKAGWASENLIRIRPPFVMYYEKRPLTSGILVHKKIANALMLAFNEIWNGPANKSQELIDHLGISEYGGCFNIRQIAGSSNYSNHSWACAIDLAPSTNGFNTGHGTMPQTVVNAFKAQGAYWGGDYHGRTDPMHFEFVSR